MSDKYTKMWTNMQDTGLPLSMEDALSLVRLSPTQSEGFALIADATDVRCRIGLKVSRRDIYKPTVRVKPDTNQLQYSSAQLA